MRGNPKLWVVLALVFSLLALSPIQDVSAISWSDETRITTHDQADMAPSIIQTSDEKIWMVWEKEVISGRAIFCKTSSDYGISWSNEKNLTLYPNQDMNQDPAITQLSNGTIMVVWSAYKVPPPEPDFKLSADPSTLSIPQGSSDTSNLTVTSLGGFSGPVDLKIKLIFPPSDITTEFNPPQVTPPPNGKINSTLTINVGAETFPDNYTIAVVGNNTSINKTRQVNINVTVTSGLSTAASTIALNDVTSVSTLSEPQEATNYEIYYKVSHDNGTSWSRDIKLTQDPGYDLGPSVLGASNGTIWVVWASDRDGDNEIYYKVSHDGVSWSSDTPLTFDPATDALPAIAQMNDGKIWVFWHSNREGNFEIFYKTYSGSTWSPSDSKLPVTSASTSDTCPAILQTNDETIWIFWKSMGQVEPPYILYTQSVDNGAQWSPSMNFTTGYYDDNYPAATQTKDTKIWVLWASPERNVDGNWEIYCKTSLVHNVAVAGVFPSHTKVYQGEIVSIKVTVQNRGDYSESFTVSCYANSTLIDSQNIFMNLKTSTNITFTWSTSVVARGNYTIRAEASVVDNEAYTVDNNQSDGTVRVKLLGDVDDNGTVEANDIDLLGNAYGSAPGGTNWNEEADMNGDNAVDIFDLLALSQNYGETG